MGIQTRADNRRKTLPKKNTRKEDLGSFLPEKTEALSQMHLRTPVNESLEKRAWMPLVKVYKEGHGIGAKSNNREVKKIIISSDSLRELAIKLI